MKRETLEVLIEIFTGDLCRAYLNKQEHRDGVYRDVDCYIEVFAVLLPKVNGKVDAESINLESFYGYCSQVFREVGRPDAYWRFVDTVTKLRQHGLVI